MKTIVNENEMVHELLGYENIKIIQNDEMFRFSIDSILLAGFVEVKNRFKEMIDLCCGNAPIPLYLTLKTKAHIIGIEIQDEVCDMAKRSVELNGLNNQIEIINDNLIDIHNKVGANKFDCVTVNPPYFKYVESSNINKNDYLTIARHEVKCTLEDIVNESKKLLIDGGFLYLVHRAERLSEIVKVIENNCFNIKRMRLVYPKIDSDEALLVLIEARKNSNSGLKILEPLYIYDSNGEYSSEVKECFNLKKTKK